MLIFQGVLAPSLWPKCGSRSPQIFRHRSSGGGGEIVQRPTEGVSAAGNLVKLQRCHFLAQKHGKTPGYLAVFVDGVICFFLIPSFFFWGDCSKSSFFLDPGINRWQYFIFHAQLELKNSVKRWCPQNPSVVGMFSVWLRQQNSPKIWMIQLGLKQSEPKSAPT